MEFRDATVDDLPVIASIFLRCWTISYASVLSESARESFSPESAEQLWRTSIETPGDKQTVLLLDGENIVGVFRIGSDKDDVSRGHLFSLYVDPEYAGRGFGKKGLQEAKDRIAGRGFSEMTLWVFADNEIANSLYLKNGFTPTGKSRTTPEWAALEIELITYLNV
jgi:ribosomal protein S18 acetylase RimI-like enzyme